jgi:hydroxymethylglutaryl-CoA lyase
MRDAIEVLQGIQDLISGSGERKKRCQVLVPNETGCRDAIAYRADELVVWIFLTDELNRITHNRSRPETFKEINTIIEIAQSSRIPVSAYIGGAFGYPGMDALHFEDAAGMVEKLLHLGCYQVCLNDEFCIADPSMIQNYFRHYLQGIDRSRLAVHFHDNAGLGLANAYAAFEEGVRTFKSCLGGSGVHSDLMLSSRGAALNQSRSPNVPTEDLVYMFEKMGVSTGIDLDRLIECGRIMEGILESRLQSRVLASGLSLEMLNQVVRLPETV